MVPDTQTNILVRVLAARRVELLTFQYNTICSAVLHQNHVATASANNPLIPTGQNVRQRHERGKPLRVTYGSHTRKSFHCAARLYASKAATCRLLAAKLDSPDWVSCCCQLLCGLLPSDMWQGVTGDTVVAWLVYSSLYITEMISEAPLSEP